MQRCLYGDPRRYLVALGLLIIGLGAHADVVLHSCHIDGIERSVQCGRFDVPENPNAPGGRQISLNIALVPAISDEPAPDPLWLLAGGPGQAATDLGRFAGKQMQRINQHRDIVLVDQRGTGKSNALNCDLPDVDLIGVSGDWWVAQLTKCRDTLDADLAHYNTWRAVEDFEAVRQALGYERINLYGGSYGTRVAQVYMRRHPESIRSVIVDAVAPVDMDIGFSMGADAQLALDRVLQQCFDAPACAQAFPNLQQRWHTLLERFAAQPAEVDIPHPVTGEAFSTQIDRQALSLNLRGLLYSDSMHRIVPLLIDQADQDNFRPLLGASASFMQNYTEQMSMGLTANILCSEDVGRRSASSISAEERASFLGTAQVDMWLKSCEQWPKYALPQDYKSPVHSDIPTLIVSGEFDPVTPPHYGERLASWLSNAKHIVVPAGGHTAALGGGRCMADIVRQFIDSAVVEEVDAGCLEQSASQPFFTTLLGYRPHATNGGGQ